jgi:hypothetical protein
METGIRCGPEGVHSTTATARGPLLVFFPVDCAKPLGSRLKISNAGTAASRVRCSIFVGEGEKPPMDINDKAPDFTLPDQDGNKVSLKEFRGKTVVLYFFPRANTPG